MFVPQLPAEHFQHVMQQIFEPAQRDPLDIAYHFDVHLNNERYRLRLYLLGRCRIMPVQAVHLHADVTQCELITNQAMLATILEVLLLQCSRQSLQEGN